MYLATDAPLVYLYDDNADIKRGSLLESLKTDMRVFPDGIGAINKKLELKQLDDISPKEGEAWLLAFEMSLTDDYSLTKEQLLTSHDWWINRLIQESDADEDIIAEIIDTEHKDIYHFLDHVLSRFTLEQLYSIGHPDMQTD
jgi:hypothetical protein